MAARSPPLIFRRYTCVASETGKLVLSVLPGDRKLETIKIAGKAGRTVTSALVLLAACAVQTKA
jgi:hypothetical protein